MGAVAHAAGDPIQAPQVQLQRNNQGTLHAAHDYVGGISSSIKLAFQGKAGVAELQLAGELARGSQDQAEAAGTLRRNGIGVKEETIESGARLAKRTGNKIGLKDEVALHDERQSRGAACGASRPVCEE